MLDKRTFSGPFMDSDDTSKHAISLNDNYPRRF